MRFPAGYQPPNDWRVWYPPMTADRLRYLLDAGIHPYPDQGRGRNALLVGAVANGAMLAFEGPHYRIFFSRPTHWHQDVN